MALEILMPALSPTMEEGTLAKWLVAEGDRVQSGDLLAEIETDKATMEFESFHEGTLLHIGIAEGETANVDALLAIIGEKGEDISGLLNGGGNASAEAKEEEKNEEEEERKSILSALTTLKSNQDSLNKKLFELTGRK